VLSNWKGGHGQRELQDSGMWACDWQWWWWSPWVILLSQLTNSIYLINILITSYILSQSSVKQGCLVRGGVLQCNGFLAIFWPFFSQTQIQNFDENRLKTAQKTT
jgi:hypothetical protein